MKNWLAACLPLFTGSLLGCSAPQPPADPEAPPSITLFTASKQQANPGESVALSWTAERATEVSLTDQTGADVVTTGTATSGGATVTPTTTSYYVLRVKGDGGRDTAFVQVAVGEAVSELTFIPIP